MTVRVYRSTDASAPTLTGQVGSLVALLDACLVNGYGALTAAGWTKSFSTTNKAAYRQNATGANNTANPMYLYVDDTGPGAGAAREARVCGFETMSAITPTGTGQFPTAAQSAIGVGTLVIRKSTTADATARAWTLVANGQTIYLWIETGDMVAPTLAAYTFVFGDFKSFKATDLYAVGIIARNIENNNGAANESFCLVSPIVAWNLANKAFGHFIARHWSGQGGSAGCCKFMDWTKNGYQTVQGCWSGDAQTSVGGSTNNSVGRFLSNAGQLPAPNGPDGSLMLSPLWISHNWAYRGYWPGLWVPLHDRPLNHNDVITVASGNLNGKTLLCQQPFVYISGNDFGNILVETSDTWT
jgi:hypothetical protein